MKTRLTALIAFALLFFCVHLQNVLANEIYVGSTMLTAAPVHSHLVETFVQPENARSGLLDSINRGASTESLPDVAMSPNRPAVSYVLSSLFNPFSLVSNAEHLQDVRTPETASDRSLQDRILKSSLAASIATNGRGPYRLDNDTKTPTSYTGNHRLGPRTK